MTVGSGASRSITGLVNVFAPFLPPLPMQANDAVATAIAVIRYIFFIRYILWGTSMPKSFIALSSTRATSAASVTRMARLRSSSSRRIEWSW